MKRVLKKISIIFIFLFIFLSLIPYVIPVTSYLDFSEYKPFPESQTQEISKIIIHYRIWYPEKEIPEGKILLIHGLGGSTYSWNKNVEFLKESGYIVVALDLPGFGHSSRNPGVNHSQKSRSDLIWNVLDNIDQSLYIDDNIEQWILAGHSMGAGTVTTMAMERPTGTKALVLVDGALFDNNKGRASFALKYPPAGRWLEVILRHLLFKEDKIEAFLTSAYGVMPSTEDVKGYLKPLILPGTESALLDFVKTARSEKVDSSIFSDIPTFAIWGGDDTWVPLEQAIKIQSLIPAMKLEVIEGAAHCPMETHYDLFNQKLIDFLTTIK